MQLETIIMAYRPGKDLKTIIDRLDRQKIRPDRIRVMLTVDDPGDADVIRADFPDDIIWDTVSKKDFKHGGSRLTAAMSSPAENVMFMTQDAIPADTMLTTELLRSISLPGSAAAYARQLPKKNSGASESFCRSYNYPEQSMIKSQKDLESMGIRAAFCSDTCAIYNMPLFRLLGGFDPALNFNEDIIYAFKALQSGFNINYCAEARVYHSHNYSPSQLFRRYRDNAISQNEHRELFNKYRSESSGMDLYISGIKHFIAEGRPDSAVCFTCETAVKYLGYLSGRYLPSFNIGK